MPSGSRGQGSPVRLIGSDARLDLAPRQEGGIDESAFDQRIEGLPRIRRNVSAGGATGCSHSRPSQQRSAKIAGLEFGCAARQIDIFDAQQQPAVCGLGHIVVQERRQRVAEMQRPIGARARNGRRAFDAES